LKKKVSFQFDLVKLFAVIGCDLLKLKKKSHLKQLSRLEPNFTRIMFVRFSKKKLISSW